MRRRDFALGCASAVLAACSKDRATRDGASVAPSTVGDWHSFAFDPSDVAPDGEAALLFAPAGSTAWPALIALHGRGEAGRGLDAGARGWRDDYALEAMHERMLAPPLNSRDVGDMLDGPRLAAINASLSQSAYKGLCIACPYTPIVSDPSAKGAASFGRFVVDSLLEKVAETRSVKNIRASTGIDGVSMGGRLALLVGLSHPEAFGSVGALQPAIHVDEAEMLSNLAKRAIEKAPITLRLVSSDGDPFLEAVRALSARLDRDGVVHQLVVTSGPHDYVWNRGPGACEMLAFHERALRGLPPP